MWYEWNSIEEFNIWHDQLCSQLGFPLIGINLATGEPDENAPKTTKYTNTIQVENKWIAFIEEQYSTNLTITDLRPQRIEIQ